MDGYSQHCIEGSNQKYSKRKYYKRKMVDAGGFTNKGRTESEGQGRKGKIHSSDAKFQKQEKIM